MPVQLQDLSFRNLSAVRYDIIVMMENVPLIVIGATIPRVKERMPWERETAADIDAEWREKVKKSDEGGN